MTDFPSGALMRFDSCSSLMESGLPSLEHSQNTCSDDSLLSKAFLEEPSLNCTSFQETNDMNVCNDCPTGVIVQFDSTPPSKRESIQFCQSDILDLEDSELSAFDASTSFKFQDRSMRNAFDENFLLENEKFGYGIPPEVLDEILKSPDCRLDRRSITTKGFSEISCRPPMLSPPVFDPLEEILQEARKIARRLSLHSERMTFAEDLEELPTDDSVTQNEAEDDNCADPNLISETFPMEAKENEEFSCKKKILDRQSVTKLNLEKNDNIENDSRVANSERTLTKSENTVPGLAETFKRPGVLSGKDNLPKRRTLQRQGPVTPKRGKPVVRSSTFAVTTESTDSAKVDGRNPVKSPGRGKLLRRRSAAVTKKEWQHMYLQVEKRDRHSSGSSQSSTSSTVSSPATLTTGTKKGPLVQNLSRPTTTTARLPKPAVCTPNREKRTGSTTQPGFNTSLSLPKKASAMLAKFGAKVTFQKSDSQCTPSRLKAPNTMSTPKSVSNEKTLAPSTLKFAPKFNLKM